MSARLLDRGVADLLLEEYLRRYQRIAESAELQALAALDLGTPESEAYAAALATARSALLALDAWWRAVLATAEAQTERHCEGASPQ